MKNIEGKIEGTKLHFTIDLSKELGPSKSGKTTMVATTSGNKSLTELIQGSKKYSDIYLGVNCYKK